MICSIEDTILFNAFKCPFDNEFNDCALKKIREIKRVDDRIEFIKNLSYTEKKKIYSKHKNCIIIRNNNPNITEDEYKLLINYER